MNTISTVPVPKKSRRGPSDRALARRTEYENSRHRRCARQPTGFFLTGGEAHDLVGADHLLPRLQANTLIADKAFDAEERVIQPLQAAGKTTVIPPKKGRKSPRDYDRDLYKARHLIENFFAKLKQFRAIATRYDKTARNFLAATTHLAASLVWLN